MSSANSSHFISFQLDTSIEYIDILKAWCWAKCPPLSHFIRSHRLSSSWSPMASTCDDQKFTGKRILQRNELQHASIANSVSLNRPTAITANIRSVSNCLLLHVSNKSHAIVLLFKTRCSWKTLHETRQRKKYYLKKRNLKICIFNKSTTF